MKRLLLISAIALTIASCDNNSSTDSKGTSDSAIVPVDTLKDIHEDTAAGFGNSSSSKFSKGSSSPTDKIDTGMALHTDSMNIKKVKAKKATKDSTHR